MKHDPQLDHILAAVAATPASESDEAFCDQTRELIGAYVELDLAGERADRAYPAVARHMAVCPDCREEYEALRELMAGAYEATLPPAALDLARIPAPAGAPPAGPAPEWARTLRRLAGAVRGQPPGNEYDLPVSALGAGVTLRLLVDRQAGRSTLRGYFTPARPDLHGASARLYGVAPAADFAVAFEFETLLEDLGEFAFDDLAPSDYVLTLRMPSGELPIALLGAAIWPE